jgi:hypothetical protein
LRTVTALRAARTSADWFHEVVVPNAQTLLFPSGKTKFVRPEDGSVGKEPGTGVVLIGMGGDRECRVGALQAWVSRAGQGAMAMETRYRAAGCLI